MTLPEDVTPCEARGDIFTRCSLAAMSNADEPLAEESLGEEPLAEEPLAEEPLAEVLAFPTGAQRPLRDVVGEVLREERHRQERTLADVAAGAAVSLPYLSEVERGRKDVSSDLLAAVCDELAIPLVEVLERCADHLRADPLRVDAFQLVAA